MSGCKSGVGLSVAPYATSYSDIHGLSWNPSTRAHTETPAFRPGDWLRQRYRLTQMAN